jgi:hypothetical protein
MGNVLIDRKILRRALFKAYRMGLNNVSEEEFKEIFEAYLEAI